MKAIILAAGVGSRLGSITKTLPKGLIDINGKSIIERQISSFRKNGINDIVLVIGNFPEKYSFTDVKYVSGKKSFPHNILFSLIEAKDELNDDVIISYGDIMFEDEIIQQLIESKHEISLAVDMNWKRSYENKSKFLVEHVCNVIIERNQITKIGYRKNLDIISDMTVGEFIGLTKFNKKMIKKFLEIYFELEKNYKGKFHESPSITEGIISDMLQELIDRSFILNSINATSKWCEIDTIDDLNEAKKIFF
jgi:choline kinase